MAGRILDWRRELERWLRPFLERLGHKTRRRMCPVYISGLIGPGDRKSIQPMAERIALGAYDQLHHFVSAGVWDMAPVETELLIQADKLVGTTSCSPAAVAIAARLRWTSTAQRSASTTLLNSASNRRRCSRQLARDDRPSWYRLVSTKRRR